jgi:ABC-type lipoprotein export system ATPase subunit
MTVLRARGLAKAYGDGRAARRILDGVDVELAPGELVAVTGPSGSGKSTLLHLLGGLDRADAGTVEVGGEPLPAAEGPQARWRARRVGFVFQAFHLVPELTAEDNVLLPARLAGSPAEARRRAGALVDELGLRALAGRLPNGLSGGEQQRFAVARALVNAPDVVLADEPTGNLDDASGGEVIGLLRRTASGGRAVLVVTHDPAVAAAADRRLGLAGGRLVA